MQTTDHDIIHLLHQEQQWHQTQLQRIYLALEATKYHQTTGLPPRKIQWKKEILAIFDVHTTLLPGEIIQYLMKNGIHEAAMPHRRTSVYVTLTRLVNEGILEKIHTGHYRKKDHSEECLSG